MLHLNAFALEIYVNGQKFDSFEAYKASKNAQLKKILLNHHDLPPGSHQLAVIGVEDGVVGALKNFYVPQNQIGEAINRTIRPADLEDVLAQAVGGSDIPKLLIASPGKLRILAFTTSDKSLNSKQ